MAFSAPIRVLLLDKRPLAGAGAAGSVFAMGHQVAGVAKTGAEALRLAEEFSPDVVLMGGPPTEIPEMLPTAGEFLKRGRVPVVILIAPEADSGWIHEAQSLPGCGFAWEPLRSGELRLALEGVVIRHRQQSAEARRERLVLQAFQSFNEAVIGVDFSGRVRFLNAEAERLTGWDEQEVLGRILDEVYQVSPRTGGDVPSPLLRRVELADRHGARTLCEERMSPVRDEHGGISGMVIFFRQVSSKVVEPGRKITPLATVESRNSPAPLADIVESISDPLAALDGRWNFTYVNSSAARLFGREKTSMVGQNLWEVLPPSVRVAHEEELEKALTQRVAANREIFLEETQTWFEARTYPFSSGSLLLLKDITSRKLEVERNHRMDRLESLGLLARGFAHDFNNLLTVLLGNLSLAEMRCGPGSDTLMELGTAKQATFQAQSLVQQLLTFARGGAPIKRMVSLAEMVRNFFYNHHRVDHVNYIVEVEEDMPEVAVDPNQIRRLISNLVRNSELAMRHGGEIRVRCEAADAARMFPNETLKDDPGCLAGVTLEIQDTGEGISAKNLKRIFEPYFSTRLEDNATGLGLTVCESIAKAHGGSISVSSQEGLGTQVRFFLPVDSEIEVEEADAPELEVTFHPGPETPPRILLLEDDHLVRALILRGLQRDGYDVTETTDGNETVRLYQQAMTEGTPFDLVVLDLSIPNGMGGLRTMEKLRALDPGVLAIVSSGYSDDPVMSHPAKAGFAAVLPKPYEPLELLRIVKAVLASRHGGRQV
ncbi:MAG: PAS domain-containing protein [Verrucomicrobium sp.]|nr:PAS domain-containing protein [Verrucomicrobium sp.]